jgi:hypothetical protein
MQHWFVYYKVEASAVHGLEPRLRRMQQEAAADSGARPRLMRRTDGEGNAATLLEVYDGIADADAFQAALEAAVIRAGLPSSLLAQRRTERFEEL